MNTERKHILNDIPTLIAISFMAWLLVVAIYKLVEYVGAAVLVETPIQAVSMATVALDWDPSLSSLMPRFVSAGGLWANLITGCVALFVLIQPKLTNKPLRYFLWLFATFSFIVSVNLFLATLLGVSDWAELTRNLEPKTIRTLIGIGGGPLLVILGYSQPVKSANGLGIGVFQVGRLAAKAGYRLELSSNLPGEVCFRLAPPGAATA